MFEWELDGLAFWKVTNTMTAAVKEKAHTVEGEEKACTPRRVGGATAVTGVAFFLLSL